MSYFYAAPSNQSGGYIVYKGARRQRGAGAFGTFRDYMAPVGRQALQGMRSVTSKLAHDVAKQAAARGAEVAAGVAWDTIRGRNVGDSLKARGKQAALKTLAGIAGPTPPPPPPPPPSRKRKKKRKQSRIPQKQAKKSLKQRKRPQSSANQSSSLPAAKRRRKSDKDLF